MKKRNKFLIAIVVIVAIAGTMFLNSCDPETEEQVLTTLGWLFSSENTEEIPDDINLSTAYGDETLPSSVDLSMYFPPIGDQGQYGTCVAWACAYNLRTYMF
ncbi:MAG: hypothetical protein PHE56_07360, partial [Bacteroidales bacterium]|nr:hypothetical protein [Bacteroidales bacterium]